MDLRSLTRENKMLIGAGAMGVYIITLFLNWAGGASGRIFGSWWLSLILAIVTGAVLAATALGYDLPIGRIRPTTLAAYTASLVFFYVLIFLFAADGLAYGFWLAFVASAIGLFFAVTSWRDDAR